MAACCRCCYRVFYGPDRCPNWTATEAQQQIRRLTTEISEHDDLYYQQGQTAITDGEYDQLRHHLDFLHGCFPALAPVSRSSSKGQCLRQKHRAPMSSLYKAKDEQAVRLFFAKARGHRVILQPQN